MPWAPGDIVDQVGTSCTLVYTATRVGCEVRAKEKRQDGGATWADPIYTAC